jgi:glucose uptake protein GlcU
MGTFFIGLSIAFPLTQTCALLSAVWGVVYFRERVARQGRFALGLVAVVAGSYFLAAAKPQS